MTAIPVIPLTAAQAVDLTDAGDSALHYHAADRALANATGTLAVANGGTGAGSFTAGRLLIGNGTGAVATDAGLTWLGGANPTLLLSTIQETDSLARFSFDNGSMNFFGADSLYAGSISLSGGNGDGTAGSIGGGFNLYAGGSAGAGGAGGEFLLYGGDGYGTGATLGGGITLKPGSGATNGVGHLQDALYSDVITWTDNTTASQLGFFAATPVIQPVAATALHTALSNLGLRAAGSPNDFALDFTNTATVGNVTINKASGTVNLGAGGTTLTLTNSLITANSRIMLTLASNPGVAIGSLYAVPAAGSCTINVTTAVVNQTKIAFEVIN